MQRFDYFIRRLLLTIPTFLGITLICFAITQLVPGGPVEQAILRMRGIGTVESPRGTDPSRALTREYREHLEKQFGFDQPFHVQYWRWLVSDRVGMLRDSFKYPNKNSWQLICSRFPVSLTFGLTGFLLSYVVCIPLGIGKALRHGSSFDFASSVIVFVGYAIPPLALGMVLKMLFCGTVEDFWDIFPVAGFQSDNFAQLSFFGKFQDRFVHMFLPVLCYVIGSFAILTMLMKNSLLEQVGKDYVRTVLARGGSASHAIWRHAFRNALIPIATGFGRVLTLLFAGSVIIEQVFEIPGMGRLSLEAIVGRDFAVFMGIVAIQSILSLLGYVLSDFAYVLIDPRIHFGKS